jgi:Glycine cleavage T-protein C-terminal barrel domain
VTVVVTVSVTVDVSVTVTGTVIVFVVVCVCVWVRVWVTVTGTRWLTITVPLTVRAGSVCTRSTVEGRKRHRPALAGHCPSRNAHLPHAIDGDHPALHRVRRRVRQRPSGAGIAADRVSQRQPPTKQAHRKQAHRNHKPRIDTRQMGKTKTSHDAPAILPNPPQPHTERPSPAPRRSGPPLEQRAGARGVPGRIVGVEIDGERFSQLNFTKWPVEHGGERVGRVTSACHSPRLERNIGYAWLPAELAATGTRVEVESESGRRTATVVPMPFIDPEKAIPVS